MGNLKTIHYNKSVVSGKLVVPGDKSISHRAIMLGSIANGKTKITGFLDGEDCLRTIDIFKLLGVSIVREGTNVSIDSPGINNWKTPTEELYCREFWYNSSSDAGYSCRFYYFISYFNW